MAGAVFLRAPTSRTGGVNNSIARFTQDLGGEAPRIDTPQIGGTKGATPPWKAALPEAQ